MTSKVLEQFPIDYKQYEAAYKDLHKNPGLSRAESYAAETAEKHLRKLGYKVTTGIGGYGLIGVLENGPGKTVLLRADMDGLPVEELTGLEYASKVTQEDPRDGLTKPVMHACGHDMHTACLMAAAETLVKAKDLWSGTLIALFQPDEEHGDGADAMIRDGLYDPERVGCPIPDVVLGQHVSPLPIHEVYSVPGPLMATADSLKITIYGKGVHGSQPDQGVNPLLIASHVAIKLAAIKATELAGQDVAVITPTCLNVGHGPNIIAETAELKVNIRTRNTEIRNKIIASVNRIVKAECQAANSPKEPVIESIVHMPLLENDKSTTETVVEAFKAHFDPKDINKESTPLVMGSEDFSVLATAVGKPCCYWFFGGSDESILKKYDNEPPFNHSPLFAPAVQPTLKIGHEALVVGAVTFFSK